jgi:lipopolysaccharide/colanic/teichoic acid biosynthesis glycosyltransferase
MSLVEPHRFDLPASPNQPTNRPSSTSRILRSKSKSTRGKESIDRLLAAILLLLFLPIIAMLVFLVRSTSRGPAIYKQTRVGKEGQVFTMYKIRSMRIDAEPKGSRPVWAKSSDPRATPMGRWLREYHLDELPQLWNVLRGEMALVGPRPERPEFVSILKEQIPEYEKRLDVRPGITGLAQMNLPPDSDVDSVRKKLQLDLLYIREHSLLLDCKLLVCTFISLIGWRKEDIVRRLRLDRPIDYKQLGSIQSIGQEPSVSERAVRLGASLLPTTNDSVFADSCISSQSKYS